MWPLSAALPRALPCRSSSYFQSVQTNRVFQFFQCRLVSACRGISQANTDPEVISHSYLPRSCFPHVTNHNNPHPLQHGEPCTVVNAGSLATVNEVGYEPKLHESKALCNGYSEKLDSTSSLLHDERNDHHIGKLMSKTVNTGNDAATTDNGESSIISNILSMEFDAWDDLAKLLSDSTENQNGPLKKSSSWNVQTNQSRFSFARQEESKNQAFDMNPSHGANQQLLRSRSLFQDFVETTDMSLDKVGIAYGFPANNIEESENLGSGQFVASSNKLSANSKPQITPMCYHCSFVTALYKQEITEF